MFTLSWASIGSLLAAVAVIFVWYGDLNTYTSQWARRLRSYGTTWRMATLIKPIASFIDHALIKSLLAGPLTILVDNAHYASGVVFLFIIDWITGVWAARMRGDKFSSRRSRESVAKAFEYILFLASVSAVAHTFPELSWVSYYSFMFIALTELFSIGENMQVRSIQIVVSQIRNALDAKNFVDRFMKKTEDDLLDSNDDTPS